MTLADIANALIATTLLELTFGPVSAAGVIRPGSGVYVRLPGKHLLRPRLLQGAGSREHVQAFQVRAAGRCGVSFSALPGRKGRPCRTI